MVLAAVLAAVAVPACSGDDEGASGGPDAAALNRCLEIAGSWAGLRLAALGSPDDARQARADAEELKANLPDSLHDDVDVVAAAFGEVAEKGIVDGAAALDTPEFLQANQAIEAHLTRNCGG